MKTNFPETLFDLCHEPFDIGVDIVETGTDTQKFVGRKNPDYDPDYICPDDSIPF